METWQLREAGQQIYPGEESPAKLPWSSSSGNVPQDTMHTPLVTGYNAHTPGDTNFLWLEVFSDNL